MKIDKITLVNFRQYEGPNTIDLSTTKDKNIILIGGKNGYGKTNFLMALVWCLYGEDIAKIDENFKKEIQKEGNYSKFLKSSLNWNCSNNGSDNFSVEIQFSEIELPETYDFKKQNKNTCKISRKFDVISGLEDLQINIDGLNKKFIETDEDKKIFINDYIIPIEAAKFVFFDAEKIANWAELSTKEEGSVLNDALGKILGLDIYEILVYDLEVYSDQLRKESATTTVRQQINSVEKGIEHSIEEREKREKEIIEIDNTIVNLKQKIYEYETYLIKHSSKVLNSDNLETLYHDKKVFEQNAKDLENKFNDLCEMIPFAISAGKLEEVSEHLTKQEEVSSNLEKRNELLEKINLISEKLFNTEPFPSDGDISFSKKIFYSEKVKRVIEEIFGDYEDKQELDFEHDLNRSDRDLINETFNYIRMQSRDIFEQTIDKFNRVKGEISDIERLIRKIESDQQDEEIIRYTNNKIDTERKLEKLLEEKGAIQNQINQFKKSLENDNQQFHVLLKKIEISELKRKKFDKANQYIKALNSFLEEQKTNKCSILENVIFVEMKKLLHKIQDGNNENFVAGVKVEPLPDNDGLKISLLDRNGLIRHKESLSQGEKQIYISSLIKAILSLSIQEYPIFIDTPLGRLDDEHIKNVLLNYYPDLAKQVVIMATNNEIPPSRYKIMQSNVAKSYLLENKNNNTKFKTGYFQSYEN